ncbi:RHS repeat-associated core domain-containing protein [Fibrobacter sp. HC4]|uniref:RHS repeat-associated core domain-containing protein n=1 Tax=Fibrobacter sp. HC4 TaxID=3239812 RepID=UPI002019E123|nr:RHS repeat-associated core domain-containing protein [Fibrobacter succinogenes]MCL4103383.1 hypothetical protein [Fibrobacter succinogenes]
METRSGNVLENMRSADWERELVTHYTGIGTEVRESFHNGTPSETKVVVNMPQGLGRYGVEDAANSDIGFGAGYIPSTKFEWYLKNHLGSTMLVYGTQSTSNADVADLGEVKNAYDYRSFGEQIDLIADAGDKVTENFTGKEKDDETELNYFGARYLDPMLGMWISVDPARQFSSPYLYVGNGYNPIVGVDPDGNVVHVEKNGRNINYTMYVKFDGGTPKDADEFISSVESFYTRKVGQYNISMKVVNDPELAENTIEFVDKIGRSYAGCDNSYNCNYAKIFTKNPGNTSGIHESGHLMGMKDRYTDEDGTFDGFVGNMMGDKENGLSPPSS